MINQYPALHLQVSGMPPALSITFDLDENSQSAQMLLIRKMVQRGYLATGMFYIMWTHEEQHINGMLAALDEILNEIGELTDAGRLRAEAGCGPAPVGFARLA